MNETLYIEVKGMHCPDCPAKVERTLTKLDGVSQVKIDFENENGYVIFKTGLTSTSDIINRINKMGFEAKKVKSQSEENVNL
ncbi:heavy-metal-associated domain-containing protein [Ornithinibacillus halotolerans]|uniref:Copper chaperone CopZ n=1 Tax=Ornithinibacillus halotolerans TaxID=1274357 RepID=A0A916RZX6_9BACI|nr:heavy metal-associated domain-containing protein [Ornithinibacillus halotolerans]GGA75108.1 hypothetical protein GCM10008025_18500 [Ornithinibacillus halotolerans]